MKTKEDFQRAIDDISEVCRKHGVFLLGTCYTEGIYGEITLGDVENPNACGWSDALLSADNNLYNQDGSFVVQGIKPNAEFSRAHTRTKK